MINKYVQNKFVYIEIQKDLFGLKQSGTLSNKNLFKVLDKEGYYRLEHTSILWPYKSRYISFTLVVDDFEVTYINGEDILHLQLIIEKSHPTTLDLTSNQFIGA